MRDECDFLHKDKNESFLQAGNIIFTVTDRHAQGTQNSRFVIFLECLKEEGMSLSYNVIKSWGVE